MSTLIVANDIGQSTKSIIEAAVKRVREAGHVIGPMCPDVARGAWCVARGRVINPIGAVLLGTAASAASLQGVFDDAAKALGVSSAWVDEFLSGFGDEEDPCGLHDDAWELGAAYRARFIGEEGDSQVN